MKKNGTVFFDLLELLSRKEVNSLEHFARTYTLKSSKKVIHLLELIRGIPKSERKSSKNIIWLRRKLYPNDETGRYFKRVLKESEEILRYYLVFRELQKHSTARQLVLLECLPLPKYEEEFQAQLDSLNSLLANSSTLGSGHALDSYRYELLHEKLIALQKEKSIKHNYYEALEYLDRFYLIEKMKYATALKLWSNIYQEELPASLTRQIEYLAGDFQEQIGEDPVLQAYLAAYQLYYNTADSQKAIHLLGMLKKCKNLLNKEEINELYVLASNFNIHKINSKHLSHSELKKAYHENFQLLKFQAEEDMLKEGEYIPYGRFQNVLAAALNTGNESDVDWAEHFLSNYIDLTPPGEQRAALENFCRGAIYFYRREFEKCFKWLEDFPYTKRFFYYCDVNSLRLRAQFESSHFFIDYLEEIQKIKRRIKNDDTLSAGHRQGYLNFFELLMQLFKSCEHGTPESEHLLKLKTKVERTHPVAQKKWLLKKIQEYEHKSL